MANGSTIRSYEGLWEDICKPSQLIKEFNSVKLCLFKAKYAIIGIEERRDKCTNPNKIAAHQHRIDWLKERTKQLKLEDLLGVIE